MKRSETSPAPKRKRGKRIGAVIGIIVVVIAVGFIWYVNNYSHANEHALAAMTDTPQVDVAGSDELGIDAVAFVPQGAAADSAAVATGGAAAATSNPSSETPRAGLIFYPGAKVQPEAYAPLMRACAERGILCVIVKPLFNLALLNTDAAIGIAQHFPDIDTWILAGHSMGGVAAGNCIASHQDAFDGLVMLAAYPDADLSDFEGKVICIVGTNDTVLNRDKYEDGFEKLPSDAQEVIIQGGNHAQYGDYGEQANDSPADIPAETQQSQTINAIEGLIRGLAA